MIGGLPEQTAREIAENVVFNLALIAGGILLGAIVAVALLLATRQARELRYRVLRAAGLVLGGAAAVVAIVFGLVLARL